METTYDSVIEQIVQSIFSTMLNAELVRVDDSQPAPAIRCWPRCKSPASGWAAW